MSHGAVRDPVSAAAERARSHEAGGPDRRQLNRVTTPSSILVGPRAGNSILTMRRPDWDPEPHDCSRHEARHARLQALCRNGDGPTHEYGVRVSVNFLTCSLRHPRTHLWTTRGGASRVWGNTDGESTGCAMPLLGHSLLSSFRPTSEPPSDGSRAAPQFY